MKRTQLERKIENGEPVSFKEAQLSIFADCYDIASEIDLKEKEVSIRREIKEMKAELDELNSGVDAASLMNKYNKPSVYAEKKNNLDTFLKWFLHHREILTIDEITKEVSYFLFSSPLKKWESPELWLAWRKKWVESEILNEEARLLSYKNEYAIMDSQRKKMMEVLDGIEDDVLTF